MKKLLITLTQAALTALLLWWVFRDSAKREQMLVALRHAEYLWLLPGIASLGLAYVFQTSRWHLLLHAQGIPMRWGRAWSLTMISVFYNFFLLGTTGGDLVRVYYGMREAPTRKLAALLTVVADRIIGLVALFAVTLFVCLFRLPQWMASSDSRLLFAVVVAVSVALFAVIVVGLLANRFQISEKLPHWVPGRRKITEFAAAFAIYSREPGVCLKAFNLSIPAHCFTFLSFYFAARAFGVFEGLRGFVDISSVIPVIQTITALPISFSGIGLREEMFQRLFSELFGTPASTSVMISVTGFLMLVVWGVVGGVMQGLYRSTNSIHVKDMEREILVAENSLDTPGVKEAA